MALAPKLRRKLYLALLGHHEKIPELVLENGMVRWMTSASNWLTKLIGKV